MIYLKQVKLLDPDLVAGDPEELKYPYKAASRSLSLSGRTGRENPPCWKR